MSGHTCIAYHDRYAKRGFTALQRTWNRYELFLSRFRESPLQHLIPIVEASAATENDLLDVHAAEYVDLIQHMDLAGMGKLDGSTPAWHGMYARAERVVGGSLLGADLIASGDATHVFNPAGGQHHAHFDRGGGFCIFNDVVAAVRRFQRSGFRRIAVLDLDGHHGDGTESLLRAEPVLTISTHQFGDRTYPGTGAVAEIGIGAGCGYTMNFPLRRGTGDAAYLPILHEAIEPVLRSFGPDVLIVEFGTDGHALDPLLRLRLSTAAYTAIARWMHRLSHDLCAGRLLVVGGGGYEPEHVVRCWMLMLAELIEFPAFHAHTDAHIWLAEAVVGSDRDADAESLQLAQRARQILTVWEGSTL